MTGSFGFFPVGLPIYQISYNSNNGWTIGRTNDTVRRTDSVTLPSISRTGYTPSGWYTAASGGVRVGQPGDTWFPQKSQTLYAQGTRDIYTITYDANGGSVTPSSQQIFSGSATTLSYPIRTGYAFSGWYTAPIGGTKIGDAGDTYTPVADITLYAQWILNSYTITYDANGGSTPAPVVVTHGQTTILPQTTKAQTNEYVFSCTGWYTAKVGGTKVGNIGAAYLPTADATLYARWSITPRKYEAKIISYSGTTQTLQVDYGTTINLGQYENAPHSNVYYSRDWVKYGQYGNPVKIAEIGGSVQITDNITIYERCCGKVLLTRSVQISAPGGNLFPPSDPKLITFSGYDGRLTKVRLTVSVTFSQTASGSANITYGEIYYKYPYANSAQVTQSIAGTYAANAHYSSSLCNIGDFATVSGTRIIVGVFTVSSSTYRFLVDFGQRFVSTFSTSANMTVSFALVSVL